MDAVADPDLNERKRAPSQQPHPAWRLELQVEFNDVSMRLARIEANAKRFLAQGSNGGTQAELRLIVGFVRTPLLLTTRALRSTAVDRRHVRQQPTLRPAI